MANSDNNRTPTTGGAPYAAGSPAQANDRYSEKIEQQYNLRDAFPDWIDYFDSWARRSADACRRHSPRLNLRYGDGPRERLDLFVPDTPAGPLVVFVHGGYWRSMDKGDFSFVAPLYLARGTSVALVNYSLFPGTTMPEVVDQIGRACRYLLAPGLLGRPVNDIHLVGWSAGAHLAAMLASAIGRPGSSSTLRPKLRSLLAISGVYDLEPLLHTSANADLRLDMAAVARNSPIRFAPPKNVRIAVLWGGKETDAFRRQSQAFADTWLERGAELQSRQLPGLHHYAIMNALADETSRVFETSVKLIDCGKDPWRA